MIGLFSIAVGTPAGIGLIVGGRIADTSGRRRLIAFALPVSTVAIVGAFMVSGVSLWVLSLVGGADRQRRLPGARRVPGGDVPDRQSQPGRRTGDRGVAHRRRHRPLAMGALLDDDWTFGSILAHPRRSASSSSPCSWSSAYPETAHQELEALNPEDVESIRR